MFSVAAIRRLAANQKTLDSFLSYRRGGNQPPSAPDPICLRGPPPASASSPGPLASQKPAAALQALVSALCAGPGASLAPMRPGRRSRRHSPYEASRGAAPGRLRRLAKA